MTKPKQVKDLTNEQVAKRLFPKQVTEKAKEVANERDLSSKPK
jgi:hypothetical protein